MMKKSIVLFLLLAVLGVAGTASAATSIWSHGVASGDWATAANWAGSQGSGNPPSATGTTWAFAAAGGTNAITVSAAGTTSGGIYLFTGYSGTPTSTTMTSSTDCTITVNSGATLLFTKGSNMWSTQAGAKSTLVIYGTYMGETAASNGMQFNLASGTSSTGTSTVKVENGGVLDNGTTGSAQSGTLNIVTTGTTASNTGTIDIYNGGQVNTKAYSIGTAGTGKIYIEAYTGGNTSFKSMWINGDATTQVAADITAHKIQAATFDGSGNLLTSTDLTSANYGYNSTLGQTWIVVPEPATVALLGLGGLMLLRRRRR